MENGNRTSTAALLRSERQSIIDEWVSALRAAPDSISDASTSALINDLPALLDSVVDVFEGKDFCGTAFLNHANSRHLWAAFSADQ